jgi:hypothetical protein
MGNKSRCPECASNDIEVSDGWGMCTCGCDFELPSGKEEEE